MGSGAFLVEACRQVGDALVVSWHVHDCLPTLPPDEDEVLHARRLVAQRCLYGVDKNPLAVDLSKLSLWLATLAKDHAFTFLDHSLRCGDSLVGLSRQQIAGFDWAPSKQKDIEATIIETRIQRAADYRRKILSAREDARYGDLSQQLELADESLSVVRLVGDLVIAAFFSGNKDRDRRRKLDELFTQLSTWFAGGMKLADREPLAHALAELRSGEHAIQPFHWEIEFPEVFGAGNGESGVGSRTRFPTPDSQLPLPSPGFDAIVGNPPFAGKNTLINGNREGYLDWLKTIHQESHGNADLVAHFFRRTFNLLRAPLAPSSGRGAGGEGLSGCFGLIATNTIGQGDTRSTGLRWICTHGGTIYNARKRCKWPGQAAVVVSVAHVSRGPMPGGLCLDGHEVQVITAYLFHTGGNDDPQPLVANQRRAFVGSYPLGMGFTFDDTDKNGVTNTLADMNRLIAKDARNGERIFPYIGGEELNDDPRHAHHRFIIDFFDRSLEEAEQWPDLIKIVRDRIKPERDRQKRDANRERWWQYAEKRPGLYTAIRGLKRVLVVAQTSKTRAFTFLPTGMVYDQKIVVFPADSLAEFSVLQSRSHVEWSFFMGSSMKDDPVYTPSDCFETFPFPHGVLARQSADSFAIDNGPLSAVEIAGREYHNFRAELMVRNNEGLTATYNRFHDPHEGSAEIQKLRELHAAMDRAVLDAYGWTDIQPVCGFALDYLDLDEEDDLPASARERIATGDLFFPDAGSACAFNAAVATGRRRLPWRYRWLDETRDEVLARLLALNAQRAEQERLTGLATEVVTPIKPRKASRKATSGKADLFQQEADRQRRYVLLLLRAWEGRLPTRRALNAGMILMLNDKLRVALLDNTAAATRKRKDDVDLNQILTELSIDGCVQIVKSEMQQFVGITPTAPATDDAPQEDVDRVNAVMEYFRREAETGKVILSEETVDAEFDFVPA